MGIRLMALAFICSGIGYFKRQKLEFEFVHNKTYLAGITDFGLTVSEVTGVAHLAVPVVLKVTTALSLVAGVDLGRPLGGILLIVVERHLLLTWLRHLLLLLRVHTLNHRLTRHLLLHHLRLLMRLEWLLDHLLIWR